MHSMYSEAFLEGYIDALTELTEGSTTVKYLNHHSLGGTFFGPALFRWFNSELKKGDSNMGVSRLYPKYIKYCKKRNYTPLSKDEFIKEGKKYYELKAKVDLGELGLDREIFSGSEQTADMYRSGKVRPATGTISSESYRRDRKFIDKAKMKHDIED